MTPIKLALNASSLLFPHAGIATYTKQLARALRQSAEVDVLLFYRLYWTTKIRDAPLPGAGGLKDALLRLIPRPDWLRHFAVEQWRFDAVARKIKFDVYHEPVFIPYRFDGPTVITIHDLSPLRYPETHPADRVRKFRSQLPDAIAQAAKIIVDSEFVGREVIEMFRVDPARVRPVHLGVSADYRLRTAEETAGCMARYGLQRGQYIFAVGTLEPRKNLVQALEAHAALPERLRKAIPLVIAGMKGWLAQELKAGIRAAEERGEVRWLGYVPPDALPALYTGARLFIYPSFYEGFGLPVLEAMASGVPVITSNQASLPEVASEAAIMVDPHDRDALRDAMLRLIEDEGEARRRAKLGLAQAARFTWRACAERTLTVYREAIQAGSRN